MESCNNEIKELLGLYYDGELSEKEHEAVELHVATCPQCSKELSLYHDVHVALELDTVKAPSGFHQDMMEKLEQLDERTNIKEIYDKKPFLYHRFQPFISVAATLVFVILLSVLGLNSQYFFQNSADLTEQIASDNSMITSDQEEQIEKGMASSGVKDSSRQGDTDTIDIQENMEAKQEINASMEDEATTTLEDGVATEEAADTDMDVTSEMDVATPEATAADMDASLEVATGTEEVVEPVTDNNSIAENDVDYGDTDGQVDIEYYDELTIQDDGNYSASETTAESLNKTYDLWFIGLISFCVIIVLSLILIVVATRRKRNNLH